MQLHQNAYLIQGAVCRVVDDLDHTSLARKVRWCAKISQAEFAYASGVDDRHDLGEIVWLFGIGRGIERPRSSGMRAKDGDGKFVDLDLGAGVVDHDCRATTWRLRLIIVNEAGSWRPIQGEVRSCQASNSKTGEDGGKHDCEVGKERCGVMEVFNCNGRPMWTTMLPVGVRRGEVLRRRSDDCAELEALHSIDHGRSNKTYHAKQYPRAIWPGQAQVHISTVQWAVTTVCRLQPSRVPARAEDPSI